MPQRVDDIAWNVASALDLLGAVGKLGCEIANRFEHARRRAPRQLPLGGRLDDVACRQDVCRDHECLHKTRRRRRDAAPGASWYEVQISERWRDGYRCNVAGGRPVEPRAMAHRKKETIADRRIPSNQPHPLQARMPAPAEDDVAVQGGTFALSGCSMLKKIFPEVLMPPNDSRGFLGPRIMESRPQPCQNLNAQCRTSN
jgi:hypothetical protein